MRNSSLLLERQLVGLAEQMTVELIMTPKPELICIAADETVGQAQQLMRSGYDQLPVVDATGEIIGLVRRSAIISAGHAALIDDYAVTSKGLTSVRTTDAIDTAIDVLVSTESALVFSPETGRFCGLLHVADLNKQAVRVWLYLWLSALEMALAEYLRRYHHRLKEWLNHVPSGNRASFLGEFILRKREGIDLSPVEGLYFSDMLVILRKLPSAPERLGLLKKDLDNLAKPDALGELRNMAMHPVRAVVRDSSDVAKLRERLNTVRRLIGATATALGEAEGH